MVHTRGLSWRNIMTIYAKQRMCPSCPDSLAEGASVFVVSHHVASCCM
jgi:hypothetical protein